MPTSNGVTNEHNPIMDVVEAAQNGGLVQTFAMAAATDEAAARVALNLLSRDVARAIAGLVTDSERYDDLMDVLDEEDRDEYLEKPGELLGRDAVDDGEDILTIAYGSVEKARARAREIGAPDRLKTETFERMMTLAAPLTLAAMARRNRMLKMPLVEGQNEEPPRGFIASMLHAIITGFKEGFMQAVTRKRTRRRRTTLSSIFGRKRTSRSRKRRTNSPSLNDLLGDLLKG